MEWGDFPTSHALFPVSRSSVPAAVAGEADHQPHQAIGEPVDQPLQARAALPVGGGDLVAAVPHHPLEAAVEIAALLREVRDFMKEQVPLILARLDSGAARFDDHERRLDDHDRRFVRVERHIGIDASEATEEGVAK